MGYGDRNGVRSREYALGSVTPRESQQW